ncbi:MAG TPA: crosslink repair DNA glycosylase YcaQ family protein, partial [Chthoniobacterales bacterium]
MGFVQADPIRAPARAQDLILFQRVKGYRAGDLERRYESLEVEEDFFVNYGYVTRAVQALMHPRPDLQVPADGNQPLSAAERKRARMLLDFVAERGAVHPREVEKHFAQGKVRNYWGGSSHATTQMLDALHYRGLLRVARREKGIRVYGVHRHEAEP